jgi:hypothetical protein
MTTTTARPTTSSATVRRARLGAAGGALVALSPAVWAAADLETTEFGTSSFVAVAVSYWLVAVIAPALIVVGVTALRTVLGDRAGRTATAGIVLSAVGFGAVALGSGIEVASLSAGGGTVTAGYVISSVGVLVGFIGSLLVGITVLRRFRDGASRIAGWLLVLAVPLAVGLGVLFANLLPDSDAGFAIATSLPTGIAWALLGISLARDTRPTAAA